jgi:hypothetical protein
MKSNTTWTALTLALALCAVVPVAQADVLIGTNGDRFTGKVVEETADSVVFDSELGGKLTIPRTRIRELQRLPPPTPPITDHRLMVTNNTSTPSTPNPEPSTLTPQASTNLMWLPPAVGHDTADWIQLKSGEWLRGRLYYIQDRKVEFDSDKLKQLSFDLKDVRQVYPARPLFTKFDGRDQIFGTVVVSNDVVAD